MAREALDRWLVSFALAAMMVGIGVRLAAALDPSSDFPRSSTVTEDAYYAFTVARNLGMGQGLTADGRTPTNGFQPLTTFIASLPYFVWPDDRVLGLRVFLLFSVVVSIAAAGVVGVLALRLTRSRSAAAVAAAAYLIAPPFVDADMNGLETGAAALLLLLALVVYGWAVPGREAPGGDGRPRRSRLAGLGVVLGLLALARIDGLIAVAMVALLHVLWWGRDRRFRHVAEAAGFTLIAVAVLSPWLLYNARHFGSIIPVSGRASMNPVRPSESGLAPEPPHRRGNVVAVVRALFDHPLLYPLSSPLRRLPRRLSVHAAVLAVGALVAAIVLRRRALPATHEGFLVCFAVLYLTALAAVYATFFGSARWFMHRYLFPPLAATVPVAVWLIWPSVTPGGNGGRRLWWWRAAVASWLVFLVLAQLRRTMPGNQDFYDLALHLQARYPGARIAMFQSGTAGFFCDDVTNLDGKVNPEAYDRMKAGRLADYVLEREFDVVADWPELVDPLMADPRLAVLFRRTTFGSWCLYLRWR